MRLWLLAFGLLGCGVHVSPDEGTSGPNTQSVQCETNPYGVCYPSEDIGTAARDDAHYGDRMPNLRFTGFRASSTDHPVDTTTPTAVSLADFYDPYGLLGNVLLVITSNQVWCGPSNQLSDFVSGANWTGSNTGGAAWARELAPLGVVFMEALNDGPRAGTAATLTDLQAYVGHHQSNYTSVLDGEYLLSYYFVDYAADPDVLVIDARSMEILSATVGFDTHGDTKLAELARSIVSSPPRP